MGLEQGCDLGRTKDTVRREELPDGLFGSVNGRLVQGALFGDLF